ncbi:DUF885 domain-containing protein [Gordonia pseudamarae]|jgi:hypothetical protein|uniref:DUF885 domain-containing protein n=1 Tax=Gordonia pseudamarae TaxID=2831662 RepID=A0ABX6IGX0_9ACTN|nr:MULTISPECIES: DUF885 domain-containing protein [Gordonia]MBD0020473.1 DUF885 domain-containing protein [Gordonia sp. (in: high G+C Gram-positive bacteria)]QHN25679.1 DUF885 domain-containing protein [Gordonia pseudamarae]QHN34611.1 DUF885 domain-containing protein [Gordonia pseudamarae]
MDAAPAHADELSGELVDDYLRLGLAFDRLEEGFVDAYTGDRALRAQVADAPAPEPAELARRARSLLARVDDQSDSARAGFVAAHLRALECSARKFAGEDIGFVDEVKSYFDVDISPGDPGLYRDAHARLAEALDVPGATGERLAEAYAAHRRSDEIPADRVDDCVRAFSGALRERVRATFPLPDSEIVEFEVVGDKPWSGFNYYLGDYRSKVAINTDLTQHMSNLPHLIAHEAYPGHHTEHCRKEEILVGGGQREQTIFLVNTPQCLMAEGLADHALHAAIGADWPSWAQEIYADLGLRFDAERVSRVGKATADLLSVRQDAALLLHDQGRGDDEAAAFLQRWLLATPERARQMLRFVTSPLWRAYISTYVEGYRLLQTWLDVATDDDARLRRFGRLLDEPLIPASLRAELAR